MSTEKSLRHTLGLSPAVDDEATTLPHPVSKTYPFIVGHRGSLYKELENTRASFQVCADMGCQAVELDIFKLMACGTLIVFHGGDSAGKIGDLIDYCGVEGTITELPSPGDYETSVRALKFNTEFAEFACPKEKIEAGVIPTLEQVLEDAKKSGIFVKIELKGPGTVQPTLDLVERLDMTSQCSYSSFDHAQLKELRSLRSDTTKYPTGALFDKVPEDYLEQAKACGATEVHLKYDTCTKDRVEEIHAAGFGSMLWMRGPRGMKKDCEERFLDVGNEDPTMYQALLDTGVQQLCINKPDVMLDYLKKFQE
eukprot:Nitzschia sp. Nitz4//scaffold186_size43309//33912//34841//NITZ4_007324-RA/size43309-processed-gene-0.9-mRNA-1//-1//CDS//3329539779//3686//frame0